MRCKIALILLTALAALFAGPAQAQDAGNATNATNLTAVNNVTEVLNDTNASAAPAVAVPLPVVEEPESVAAENASEEAAEAPAPAESAPAQAASRFKKLSVYAGESQALGTNVTMEYANVSQSADRTAVFTRGAGELSPSTKLGISKVGTGVDRFVEVTSQAVGEWDLSGWALSSAGNITYTFPSLILEQGAAVRVHVGAGAASATDIYTNSSEPLWIDSFVSLQDAEGDVVSTFDVSSQPVGAKWVDPLASQIQF
jgi:hypothetical protein